MHEPNDPSSRPWSEADRLAALQAYELLDTPREPEFDDITQMAAQACGAPIALLNLIDGHRQWFKAELGFGTREMPIVPSFCTVALHEADMLLVPDLSADPRFAEHALVLGPPHARFYAGVPLKTPEGLPIGVLCIMDRAPRALSAEQGFILRALARAVMARLEQRKALRARDRALAREQLTETRSKQILDSAIDYAIVATDLDGQVTLWSEGASQVFGWDAAAMLGRTTHDLFTPEDRARGVPDAEMHEALRHGKRTDERWYRKKNGDTFWASGKITSLHDGNGTLIGFSKVLRDRTEQRRAAEKIRADAAFLESILAASGDCLKVLDLDARLLFMNEGGKHVMEVSDFNAIHGCPWPGFWQGAHFNDALAAIDVAKAGGIGHFLGAADTMAGNSKWWDVQVTAIPDANGRPEKLLAVSRDMTAMHLAEQALRSSEAHWRGLFEKLQEGVILGELIRAPDGTASDWRMLDFNLAWVNLTGCSHAEAVGRTVRELFPGIDQAWIDEVADVVASREPRPFLRSTNSGKWYEGHSYPLTGERFATVFVEVTELRQRDARRLALLELDQRLRDLDDTDDPSDMAFAAAEIIGRALQVDRAGYGSVNRAGTEVFVEYHWTADGATHVPNRYPADEYGPYIADLRRGEAVIVDDVAIDPRTAPTHQRYLAQSVQALVKLPIIEQQFLVAFFFVSSAAPRQWIPEEIDFMRNVAARTRSAVERRRAERDLRELAASLEQLVESRTRERDRLWQLSRDPFLITDAHGRWLRVNPAWTELLGWSEAELLGRTSEWIEHPDDRAGLAAGVSLLAGAQPAARMETRFRTREGDYRWFSWTAVQVEGLRYCVARDVTYEREQAAARDLLEAQLRQSQKMEAVGQLTGGLAHDFNNLLTGISGSLELLHMRVAQGRVNGLDRYITAAQGAAKRAAALTHRLLAFSRRQTLDPVATDVDRLIASLEELIRRTVGPAIGIDVIAAPQPWATLIDQNQLENALLNLCINARDAMPDGGRITIETSNHWLDERAAHEKDLAPGPYLSLCVSDTGMGMTPEVIARAFDPFFTTKPIGQGTGLGLSMIYGFARQSGGQVEIRSRPGAGTEVCLYLARHHERQPAGGGDAAHPQPARAPRAEQGETVLVVDDEATVRMLVTEVLEDLGYTAIEAADGPAGLQVIASGARIDLLVTDVGLPGGLNGRQLADAARVVRPGLKVLFITGYAENATVGDGDLEPGMHLLTKPFAIDVLASRISELLDAGA
ncbi:MAG: PAS domain S-box protein [Janthinobacterium lividum]